MQAIFWLYKATVMQKATLVVPGLMPLAEMRSQTHGGDTHHPPHCSQGHHGMLLLVPATDSMDQPLHVPPSSAVITPRQ